MSFLVSSCLVFSFSNLVLPSSPALSPTLPSCPLLRPPQFGKDPEEIRKEFDIVNDFSPEEELHLREENAWAFDNARPGNATGALAAGRKAAAAAAASQSAAAAAAAAAATEGSKGVAGEEKDG